jgi:hypothetical protein
VSTGAGETAYWPVVDGSCNEPCGKSWTPAPGNWNSMGVAPPKGQLYCGYAVVAGVSNSLAGAGAFGQGAFNNVAPTVPWWYVVATCDNDGNSSTNAIFVTTSQADTFFEQNVHN